MVQLKLQEKERNESRLSWLWFCRKTAVKNLECRTYEDSKILLIDLTDFLINKFDEKDYFEDSIENCSLFYIILLDSFKHTDIKSFYEKAEEISTKLKDLYDDEKFIFLNEINKKEIKYSSLEICFYFLAMLLSYKEKKSTIQDRNMISNLYKKYFINSPLVLSSWWNHRIAPWYSQQSLSLLSYLRLRILERLL